MSYIEQQKYHITKQVMETTDSDLLELILRILLTEGAKP